MGRTLPTPDLDVALESDIAQHCNLPISTNTDTLTINLTYEIPSSVCFNRARCEIA